MFSPTADELVFFMGRRIMLMTDLALTDLDFYALRTDAEENIRVCRPASVFVWIG